MGRLKEGRGARVVRRDGSPFVTLLGLLYNGIALYFAVLHDPVLAGGTKRLGHDVCVGSHLQPDPSDTVLDHRMRG